MPGGSPIPNRYIKSDLKSHRILWEEERPIRWPYMKILREYSTLKEFYPVQAICGCMSSTVRSGCC